MEIKYIDYNKQEVVTIKGIPIVLDSIFHNLYLDTQSKVIRFGNGVCFLDDCGKTDKTAIKRYNNLSAKGKDILKSNYDIIVKKSFNDYYNEWQKFKCQDVQEQILKELGIVYNTGKYYDKFEYYFKKLYKFDPISIDRKLKDMYKDYTNDISMKEFITNKFEQTLADRFVEYI